MAPLGTKDQKEKPKKLRKAPSSDHLAAAGEVAKTTKENGGGNAVDAEVEEMRTRAARNRTFLHVQVSRSVGLRFEAE